MKIYSRRVNVSKSFEEITHILKSSGYYFSKEVFTQSRFSFHCAKRRNGGYLSLIPVKGDISQCENHLTVLLEVHADPGFILGGVIMLSGILLVLWGWISHWQRWMACIGMVLLGLHISGQSIWEAIELLDLLEHKLTR